MKRHAQASRKHATHYFCERLRFWFKLFSAGLDGFSGFGACHVSTETKKQQGDGCQQGDYAQQAGE